MKINGSIKLKISSVSIVEYVKVLNLSIRLVEKSQQPCINIGTAKASINSFFMVFESLFLLAILYSYKCAPIKICHIIWNGKNALNMPANPAADENIVVSIRVNPNATKVKINI